MKDDIRKEAVSWFIRLRDGEAGSSERHALNDWLASDESHRLAYDQVCQEWMELDGIEDWARGELAQLNLASSSRVRHRLNRSLLTLAVAASLVGAVALMVLFNQPERFQTLNAEQRQLTLDDGSRLHLNPGTELEVRYEQEYREITLRQGESIFDVESDAGRPFLVRAGGHSVIALGTRFSVDYRDQTDLEVIVLEGKVAVVRNHEQLDQRLSRGTGRSVELIAAEQSESVILEQDQSVIISQTGTVLPVLEVNAADETAWQEGKLIFDETPLREVVNEMARYIPGDIRVADNVPDHPVTGIIQIRGTESMLDFLSEVVPITPVRQSASLTVVHRAPSQPPNG